MPEPTVKLTPEQISFYKEQGYLSLGPLSTPDELAMMRNAYDRIFSTRAGRDTGDQFDLGGDDQEGKEAVLPQILNPDKYAPEFKDTLLAANVRQIAKQLLGDHANGGGAHAIMKPAFHGATTPWHQDGSYWSATHDNNGISIWVPLQDVTVANGCMQFVPGSHKLDIQPHHSINHDPKVHGLEIDFTDEVNEMIGKAVACPLPAGGATIHAGRMFHYAGPNTTDQPRRAYILSYATPATLREKPRSMPWNELKQTARQQRAKNAQTAQAKADHLPGQ